MRSSSYQNGPLLRPTISCCSEPPLAYSIGMFSPPRRVPRAKEADDVRVHELAERRHLRHHVVDALRARVDELVVVGLIRLSAPHGVSGAARARTEPLAPAPSVRMSLKLARKAWASA